MTHSIYWIYNGRKMFNYNTVHHSIFATLAFTTTIEEEEGEGRRGFRKYDKK